MTSFMKSLYSSKDYAEVVPQPSLELCAKGGFWLDKLMSNHHSVLATIHEDQRAKGVKTLNPDRDQLPVERALGAQWNVEQETYTFSM